MSGIQMAYRVSKTKGISVGLLVHAEEFQKKTYLITTSFIKVISTNKLFLNVNYLYVSSLAFRSIYVVL
jgi:hypothetical protein